jgi:hypothetical protein
MINPYFAERYAEERQEKAMQAAEISRLVKKASPNRLRFPVSGRVLLSIRQHVVAWGPELKERYKLSMASRHEA